MLAEIKIGDRSYKSLSYNEYSDRIKIKLLSSSESNLSEEEKERINYTRLNLQRSLRIEKSYSVPENVRKAMEEIRTEQLWLVITEDWCGDSAQNLPYIYLISQCSTFVNLRIVLRDSNPELIDMYLTNGTRSIPKLIAFDAGYSEIFRWGPRPKAAQEYFLMIRNSGIPKDELYEKLHQWYSKNKGQELEGELLKLVSNK